MEMDGPTSTVRRRRRKRKTSKSSKSASSTNSAATTTTTTSSAPSSITTTKKNEVEEAVAVAATTSSGGIDSVLGKLRDSVLEEDLYTALQVYKALFIRFAKQGDIEPATELAAKGSCLLLRRGLTRAATDLALELVTLFTESHTKVNETRTSHLLTIAHAYPTHPSAPKCNGPVDDTSDEDSQRFLIAAVNWSSKEGKYPRGDPRLNYESACAYRRTGDAMNACTRYMFSEETEEYASYLYELATKKGYRGELDLFLARAVLQLLAVENIRDSRKVQQSYTKLATAQGATLDTPLTNFTVLLLEVVQRGKPGLPLFQLLQKRYQKSINRDEILQSCMGRIATRFFGVAPPKQGGMMGMLNSLLGGGKK
jgi:hypothetical protein